MNSSSRREFVIDDLKVHHDTTKSKFCIQLDDDNEAILVYEKKKDMIDFYHTEVPMGFTGRGIAGILAKCGRHSVMTFTFRSCVAHFDKLSSVSWKEITELRPIFKARPNTSFSSFLV